MTSSCYVLSKALKYCTPSARELKRLTVIANEAKELVSNCSTPKILDGTFWVARSPKEHG